MVVSDESVTLTSPERQGKPGVGLTILHPLQILQFQGLCCREPQSRDEGCQMGGSRKVVF